MEFNNLITLMQTMSGSALTEFQYEENGVKIYLSKSQRSEPAVHAGIAGTGMAAAAMMPEAQTAGMTVLQNPDNSALQNAEKAAVQTGNIVTSPLVGVFYAAPAEDAEPFVSVGDTVKKGQQLAIVEAMKLMNEIECEYNGTVAEILVENGQAVEYGQPLFRII